MEDQFTSWVPISPRYEEVHLPGLRGKDVTYSVLQLLLLFLVFLDLFQVGETETEGKDQPSDETLFVSVSGHA
jgi:hypothetical protein